MESKHKSPAKTPLVLCILDGWGEGTQGPHNAIDQAQTPCFDLLKHSYPVSYLEASGPAVGLPEGQMGNSEVGHMTIGAGRILNQDLTRIQLELEDRSFLKTEQMTSFLSDVKNGSNVIHLVGLLSDGGVHSHLNHLVSFIHGISSVPGFAHITFKVHGILDGRDTSPKDGVRHLEKFLGAVEGCNVEIATLGGRYFAMDRDHNWDRIDQALGVIEHGIKSSKQDEFIDPFRFIQHRYDQGQSDEFIEPASHESYTGFQQGDALVAFNFRADRMRQILSKLRSNTNLSSKLGFVSYQEELDADFPVLFPKKNVDQPLGQILSQQGYRQLRVAETEKYAHVTYFFNGGKESPFEQEDRIMIPSPSVATYDLKPEMSAVEVKDNVCDAINKKSHDVIIVNFANPDMVGHTGDFLATVKAVETVDTCLKEIVESVQTHKGCLMVTADHGNADEMLDPSLYPEAQKIMTSHSLNPVPFILADYSLEKEDERMGLQSKGGLCQIAPTILDILGIKIPQLMTGKSLVIR